MACRFSLEIVPGVADWRLASSYHGLLGRDAAVIMWEWYRRDRSYRTRYTQTAASRPSTHGGWTVHSDHHVAPTDALLFRRRPDPLLH
jgi:hypothetical protein